MTFYGGTDIPVFLLSSFAKGDKANLTKSEVHVLRTVLGTLADEYRRRTTPHDQSRRRAHQAATEALEIARGEANPGSYRVHLPEEINVRVIRSRLNMSQGLFAKTFGIDVRTLQDWEQGRRVPTGPAQALLKSHLPGTRSCQTRAGGRDRQDIGHSVGVSAKRCLKRPSPRIPQPWPR